MARPKKTDTNELRSVFCAVRLSPANVDKLQRLSPLAGAPGDRSKTLRWLIETMPEPAELAKQAMAAQRG
jgi:hypothetical protein